MVTVSETAADKTKEILTAEGKDGWAMRFFTAGSSCCGPSFGIDIVEQAEDGDEVIELNGAKFCFEKSTFESLSGKTIDFVDNGEQQGFAVTGGEAPSCGSSCGSSCG